MALGRYDEDVEATDNGGGCVGEESAGSATEAVLMVNTVVTGRGNDRKKVT
jgi:hypothetical protein